MAVYYKFKSLKDYFSIPIEGQFISVANLKERIFENKSLAGGTDTDLMITNAQTNEDYVDEGAMIPKNTSVLIRRIPGKPRRAITDRDKPQIVEPKVSDLPAPSSMLVGDASTMKYPEESEWDEFGNDLYAIPETAPAQAINPLVEVAPADNIDEDSKIKALIETPALDWNCQSQDSYGAGRGFGRGIGGRMLAGRGFGRGGLERKTPPAGYVCHRCKVSGHFIQHCPTNGDPNFDIKRVKPPTGIPKSMLITTPDGSYALPSGAVAVLKPNEAAFEKEIEGLPSTRPVSEIPSQLCCPLCKEVMKDAVLTSKCCFASFCDKCIRDYLIGKSMCVCGATNMLADHLLPNKTVRETISRLLEATTSSTENIGSQVHVQDMESARPAPPRVPSPTLSAASKDEIKLPTVVRSPHLRDSEGAIENKPENVEMNNFEKKVGVKTTISEATDSKSKEPTKSPESAPAPPAPEVTQDNKQVVGEPGKKKKKKKARVPGSDMQWKAYQDLGPENYMGMPLAASGYSPCWAGGMPMGMDGYMAPFGGPMPFMGYQPGPFDMPFGGGIFPQDPFAAQGYMMPVVPRDLCELGMGNMGMNNGHPPLSREEVDARRAAARHKREMERRSEMEQHNERGREQSKDKDTRRESRSIGDVPPMKIKPRKMGPNAASPSSSLRFTMEDEKSINPVDKLYRTDRPEKSKSLERHNNGQGREFSSHSPPRQLKRKAPPAIEQDDTALTADQKHKASVFSRISFPGDSSKGGSGDGSASKKRKSDLPPVKNGLKDHNYDLAVNSKGAGLGENDAYLDDWKSMKSSSSRRAANVYEPESSEEYHFKRKPSSSRRDVAAEMDDRWPGSRGPKDHDHSRDRPSSKRR